MVLLPEDLTPKQSARLAAFAAHLFEAIEHEKRYEAMTNEQLADELVRTVWADMVIYSPEACLVDVIADRLKGLDDEP